MKDILLFFWEEMKPYKWWYLLLFQTLIFAPICPIVANYAIKELIDILTNMESFEPAKFYLPTFLYIFSEIYINVVWRLSNFAGLMCIPQTQNAILLKSYNYVQYHSYRFFTETLGGSIVSKIEGIAKGFSNIRDGLHFRVGMPIVESVFYIVAILFFSPIIGFIFLVWCLPFIFIIKKLALKLEKANEIVSEATHEVKGKIADRISNIFNLFSFGTRKREYVNLERHIKENVLPKQKNTWKYEIIFQSVSALFYTLLMAVMVWGVIYLRYFGNLSIGDAIFIMLMGWRFMEAVWRASVEFGALLKDYGDLKAAFEIIAKPQEILDKKTAIELQI